MKRTSRLVIIMIGALGCLLVNSPAPGRPVPPAFAGEQGIRCATYMPGMPGKADVRPVGTSRMADPRVTPAGPPPDPGVGDSWLWYVWHLAGPPWAELKSATVRGMGEHCYVVVEDSQWNVSMNQADVDRIVAAMDSASVGSYPTEGVWSLDTGTFGQPPDALDGDPRIYLFYYDFDVAADGFFWVFDEFPDGTQPYASNECEVVYLDCVTSDPGSDYMIAVMAHEFEHMIHWAHDDDEEAWVDEGIAEYAMWLYGNPDPLGGFAANPDNDLTAFSGSGADYQQTYLYMLYLHERFGGRPMLTTLVNEPANGITGVTNALTTRGTGETFVTVFRDWCVANYLDDTTIGDGRYGYAGETVPHLLQRRFTTYPQSPPGTSVNRWAADYLIWLNGAPSLTLGFNGLDAGQFTVYLVQMGGGFPSYVERKTLSVTQDGSWNLPGFSTWVDSVLLVVEDPRTAGALATYTFSGAINPTGAVAAGGTEAESGAGGLALDLAPNPATREIRLTAHGISPGEMTIDIFTADGRRVAALRPAPGEREMTWDGSDASGYALPAGVYWARLTSAEGAVARKLVITR